MWKSLRKMGLVILGMSLFNACASKRQKIETISPTGMYSFHFETVYRGGRFSLIQHGQDAFYSFYKENRPVFENRIFFEDEFKYRSFEKIYPELRWVADNVLRMGSKAQSTEALEDEVKISNDTEKIISLVTIRVGSYETFLVTDLQPHQTIPLYAQSQARQDYGWVQASSELQTGVRVSGGQDFRILGQQNGAAHYCLSIKEGELAIRSQEFEVIEQLPDDKKKITPKGCPPR